MQRTIDETNRRREKQLVYNEKHGITPTQIFKAQTAPMFRKSDEKAYAESDKINIAADPIVKYMDNKALEKAIEQVRKNMEKAASELNFIEAARLRDEIRELEKLVK